MWGLLIGKSLAVKVVAGVAAVTVAGTGFAAETGTLPAPVQQAAYDVAGGLGVPAPRDVTDGPATDPTGEPEPETTPSAAPSASTEPEPEPSEAPDDGPDASGPAAKGLCQAYRSGANRDSTAQQALARAAGGADRVAGYCDGVLAHRDARTGGGREDRPAPAAETPKPTSTKDTGKGKGNGSDKQSGKGSDKGSDKGSGKDRARTATRTGRIHRAATSGCW